MAGRRKRLRCEPERQERRRDWWREQIDGAGEFDAIDKAARYLRLTLQLGVDQAQCRADAAAITAELVKLADSVQIGGTHDHAE